MSETLYKSKNYELSQRYGYTIKMGELSCYFEEISEEDGYYIFWQMAPDQPMRSGKLKQKYLPKNLVKELEKVPKMELYT